MIYNLNYSPLPFPILKIESQESSLTIYATLLIILNIL